MRIVVDVFFRVFFWKPSSVDWTAEVVVFGRIVDTRVADDPFFGERLAEFSDEIPALLIGQTMWNRTEDFLCLNRVFSFFERRNRIPQGFSVPQLLRGSPRKINAGAFD